MLVFRSTIPALTIVLCVLWDGTPAEYSRQVKPRPEKETRANLEGCLRRMSGKMDPGGLTSEEEAQPPYIVTPIQPTKKGREGGDDKSFVL